jgi:hypothetical protein
MIPKWLSARWPQLVILLLLAISCLSFAISCLTWHLIERMNRPELSINQVYLRVDENGKQSLVVDYQNVGHARIDWFEIAIDQITNNISVQETISVVRANPFLAGVSGEAVTKLVQSTPMLVLCARWLGDNHELSTAQWYYRLDTDHQEPSILRYADVPTRERAFIVDLNPCQAAFSKRR